VVCVLCLISICESMEQVKIVPQQVFPTFCTTDGPSSMLARAHHFFQSWTTWIEYTPCRVLKIHFNIHQPHLGFPQAFAQFSPPKHCLHLFFLLHKLLRATVPSSGFNDHENNRIQCYDPECIQCQSVFHNHKGIVHSSWSWTVY
jgi:hypothetical protein